MNELTTIKAGKGENWVGGGGGGSSCLSTWGFHKSLAHVVDAFSDGLIMRRAIVAFLPSKGFPPALQESVECSNDGSMFGVSTLSFLFLGVIVVGFGMLPFKGLFLQYLIGLEGKGGDHSFENGCHHVSSA